MVHPGNVEDCELVVRTLAGRREAFAALVRRHQRAVFSIPWRLTGDREVAEELAQEAFLRAYQSLATFDVTHPLAPWLYHITTNLSLNWLKRKQLPTVPLEQVTANNDRGVS